jgi:hypothetical protein
LMRPCSSRRMYRLSPRGAMSSRFALFRFIGFHTSPATSGYFACLSGTHRRDLEFLKSRAQRLLMPDSPACLPCLGTIASASAAVLGLLATEGAAPVQPINATSHWLHGDKRAR